MRRYRLKLYWIDGGITYSAPCLSKRIAHMRAGRFRNVGLIARVKLVEA